jgi:hypothetical protein
MRLRVGVGDCLCIGSGLCPDRRHLPGELANDRTSGPATEEREAPEASLDPWVTSRQPTA